MANLIWTILPIIVSILSFTFVFITKWTDPNNDRIGYPFDIKGRVRDLISVADELRDLRQDMCRLIPVSAWEQDEGWIRRVDVTLSKAANLEILHDEHKSRFFGNCKLGREADIEAKRIRNLITEGRRIVDTAKSRPLPVHGHMLQVPQWSLLGMDSAFIKIAEFVEADDSSMSAILGICGMCGTGKSSLLKLVWDRYSRLSRFEHVIFAVASYECSVSTLQKIILSRLGLNIAMVDEESNATVIFNVLKDKSFLLLLDNLWIRADLEKIGIPMPLKSPKRQVLRRKVIFTTRSSLVCAGMECANHYITSECLNIVDSWKLFEGKVGDEIIYSHPHIPYLARQVVDACNGLPIALCTVGRVMSIMDDPKDWWEAVKCVKRSGIMELLGANNDLFHSLKVSYDHLEEIERDCFLVCSLLNKGENIRRDTLLRRWAGLGLLDISHASSRGHMIIAMLLAVGLLEKGDNDSKNSEHCCVKMHPILHDMSSWIVRENKKCWIPLLNFSLSLSSWHHWPNLTFLDLSSLASITEFPKEICYLVKLQHLDISGTKISSLPFEMVYLSELKVLYLRQMKNLKQIPCWAISNLKKLHVLDLFSDVIILSGTSFHMLPSMESPGQAYCSPLLLELERSNMQLEVFGVCLQTMELVKILGHLPRACLRSLSIDNFAKDDSWVGYEQGKMNLNHLPQTENLVELTITRCYLLKELVAEGDISYGQFGFLPNLEHLCLGHFEKVIWKNAGINLRDVLI